MTEGVIAGLVAPAINCCSETKHPARIETSSEHEFQTFAMLLSQGLIFWLAEDIHFSDTRSLRNVTPTSFP